MVAFWISTFAPLFWMTVGIPLALANEPSRTMFDPVATLMAALSLTVPDRRA